MNIAKTLENYYEVECFDSEGNLKWADTFKNLITTAGASDSLNAHLKGGAQTTTWYVGLTGGTPTFAIADTMASHGGWTDDVTYSNATRPTLTLGALTGTSTVTCDNSASKAVFNINGTATMGGAFVTSVSTKGGTTGILYGGGAFSGGNRSVINGDTLNVTITTTCAAA